MIINMLKSKIHRAVVTEANLDYVGSITIDSELLEASGLLEYEQVQVVDINNGNRLITYAIAGPKGKGDICLNGAAARLVSVGDKVIIMAYCQISNKDAKKLVPKIVFVNDDNKIIKIKSCEVHGEIE